MYLQDYFVFLLAIGVCMIFSAVASHKVNSTFHKYNRVRARSGYTGADVARHLMSLNGVHGVAVGRVGGKLTDHYHPAKSVVNLSESTYGSSSVAALAVAAHEIGHVMQKHSRYGLYNLRTALVPIVNFGSHLAMPMVVLGLLIEYLSLVSTPDLGFNIAMIGVLLYGGALLFALVTLPVELNASRRAKEMLLHEGILYEDEIEGAQKVLSAAALTYLASVLTNLVYFLRFLIRVLTMFGRRERR